MTPPQERHRMRLGSIFCRAAAGISLVAALAAPGDAAIKAEFAQLPNGLKIILYPDRQAPVVAARIFYVTGSVHEHPGNTGIAHLLEHMLFKGTRKVGVKDFKKDSLILRQ